MKDRKIYRAIGLMSGTSLDGVDAALIETDGLSQVKPLSFVSIPYEKPLRDKLRACLGAHIWDNKVAEAEREMTLAHVEAVKKLGASGAEIIGFHGQTLSHDPAKKHTFQIGDAKLLAKETGIDVVADFRSADVKAGGQGAPLLPLYHRARAIADNLPRPLAILNIGGVANVTWIGRYEEEILAFDTGPGNALMDDFIRLREGVDFDDKGRLASKGKPNGPIIHEFLHDPYFKKPPPKSLDRDYWTIDLVRNLSTEDGMATLLAMTAASMEQSFKFLPQKPKAVYVTGGGRKNQFLMHVLPMRLPKSFFAKVKGVETLGWNGDALEAEGFAYLAVRSLLGEPLSLPTTTGVPQAQTGGVLVKA